jgi:glycosyltransferase involved in cell wall biosynthesis
LSDAHKKFVLRLSSAMVRAMKYKDLRIIAPFSKDFLTDTAKAYTGAQHFSRLFLEYFDQTSFTVIGMALTEKLAETGVAVKKAVRNGKPWLSVSLNVTTKEILLTTLGKESKETRKIIHDLGQELLAEKPDIFFLNGLSAVAYLFALAAEDAGIPIVSVHHGVWTLEAGAHPALVKDGEAIRLRKKAEKRLIDFSKRNIFLTRRSYRFFREAVGRIPKHQQAFISLPYNPAFVPLNPHPPRVDSVKKRIGLIGRWDPIKNHEAYLALAHEAKKQKLPWTFVSATTISPHMVALQSILEDYEKTIEIVPHLSPSKLRDFYRSLDVIIVPSHFETFCGVVMEALMQQIPVLVSPGVGMADVLMAEGMGSSVISFDSPKKTIQRLRKLMSVPVPERVREHMIEHFEADDIFGEYKKLFLEVYAETKQPKMWTEKLVQLLFR